MASQQVKNGKAFEYALLLEVFERLAHMTRIEIHQNAEFHLAKSYFDEFAESKQGAFRINASAAINFLIDVEPRLSHAVSDDDCLILELVSDKVGQSGDVRDVLTIRHKQNWQIGISAKNNHRAVKHSRLSKTLDFGDKWLGMDCSQTYFDEIEPIFNRLSDIKINTPDQKWDVFQSKEDEIYMPILKAFKRELLRLNDHPVSGNNVARSLVHYLIGKKDFYKVIKGKDQVEIQAYNINETLNLPSNDKKPKFKIGKVKLPNKLLDVSFAENLKTTIIVTMNEGWQISFRIHNASSRVEASLKFDINLISTPRSVFNQHIGIG